MSNFKERANDFTLELNGLLTKYKVMLRPIITEIGPDIRLEDVLKQEEEQIQEKTEAVEEAVEKLVDTVKEVVE